MAEIGWKKEFLTSENVEVSAEDKDSPCGSKPKKRTSSSSSSSSSSNSSKSSSEKKNPKIKYKRINKRSDEYKREKMERRKRKKLEKAKRKELKREQKKKHKEEKRLKKLSKNMQSEEPGGNDCFIPIDLMSSKATAPETKEEYDARQSKIRREIDPVTGRTRLVKGDGEILEEIVSKDRHEQINKLATKGDGDYFQSKTVGWNIP